MHARKHARTYAGARKNARTHTHSIKVKLCYILTIVHYLVATRAVAHR